MRDHISAGFIAAVPYIPSGVRFPFEETLALFSPFCFFAEVFRPFEEVLPDTRFSDIFSDFSRERYISSINFKHTTDCMYKGKFGP